MNVDVTEVATPELVSETALAGDRIEVRLVGSAEVATRTHLSAYLEAVHRAALDQGAAEVAVDLRALTFISAGGLGCLLGWLAELRRTPRYVARFVCDAKRPWQRRCLEALVAFGGALVRLDERSAGL